MHGSALFQYVWLPFLLDPDTPEGGMAIDDYMARKVSTQLPRRLASAPASADAGACLTPFFLSLSSACWLRCPASVASPICSSFAGYTVGVRGGLLPQDQKADVSSQAICHCL